jgi:hypothetical protein
MKYNPLVLSVMLIGFFACINASQQIQLSSTLLVNGVAFPIRGINYSPVPPTENVNWAPFGDYFTVDYAYQWERDLPIMKAMGVNTIRLYSWDVGMDHSPFLDVCHAQGIKVILTFYLSHKATPIETEYDNIISSFAAQVGKYKDHPAVLAWIFGNELNGDWNGWLGGLSIRNNCGWTSACYNVDSSSGSCHAPSQCVYSALFSWINEAAKAAKNALGRSDGPVIGASFADSDTFAASGALTKDKLALYDKFAPDLDLYCVQLYRGRTFGGYFSNYKQATSKLLLVSEYGVDAYNDACGWAESDHSPCHNIAGDGQGGATAAEFKSGCNPANNAGKPCNVPGEQSQTDFDTNLAQELEDNNFVNGGPVAGGLIMAWNDEFWKGEYSNKVCTNSQCTVDIANPLKSIQSCLNSPAYAVGGSAGCMSQAHISCNNKDPRYHDLCGGINGGFPDGYVNEEWFGLNSVQQCPSAQDQYGGHTLSILKPRPVLTALANIWKGDLSQLSSLLSSQSCEQFNSCWKCSTLDRDFVWAGHCSNQCEVLKVVSYFPSSGLITAQASTAMAITTVAAVISFIMLFN